MPTATATVTTSSSPAVIPLKAASSLPPSSSTLSTLRSLYSRAARAFLHRQVDLAHSLISSAFSILRAPSFNPGDTLCDQRRKWDLLRITLETTIYSSPPVTGVDSLPEPLRASLELTAPALISSLYSRSLLLFTPVCATSPKKPDAAYLPSTILVTLVWASLKLESPDSGRAMIEDWLSRRGTDDAVAADPEGYEKVLELYCLHVLPRLEQWDYATEFLQYEGELSAERRDSMKASLQGLYSQAISCRRPPEPSIPTPSPPVALSPRSFSPAPSTSSTSSSLSTTSTHTAVPRTPRANSNNALTQLAAASRSTASLSSNSTVTYKRPQNPRRRSHRRVNEDARSGSPATLSGTSRSRSTEPRLVVAGATRAPSTYALIKATISPFLTTSKLTTFLLLFVVFPTISLLFRLRRRRLLAAAALAPSPSRAGSISTAEQVRRRLKTVNGAEGSVVGTVWNELVKAVVDTVKMGGSGLV